MTADQLLNALFNAGIAISVGATVLSLGMTYTAAQLLAPLKRVWLVIVVVIVNAVAIPAIAWLVAEALPISDAYVAGLVLATLGAGSAAALKGAQLAERADLPLAVSLVVVLQLSNIVAVPLWAGRVVSGATLSAWDILKSLLALVLIPLVVGLVARARYAEHAQDWTAGLVKVANVALVIALAAGIAVNWAAIVEMFGSWVLVASLIIIAVGVLLGALVGGRDPRTHTTTALLSGLRFGSLGLIVIGTQLDGNPDYLGPAITFALLDFVLPLLLAIEVGRKVNRQARTPRPRDVAQP